ncbi:MAG: DUF6444 domain-containing protein [Pirellulaceae bacterium]
MARTYTEGEVQKLIEAAVSPLKALLVELEAEIVRLRSEISRLKTVSSISSKPPSSDIVKPPRPNPTGGKRGKRCRGGQPGHARHTRPLFPPEQVDHAWLYELPASELGPEWEPLDEYQTLQQVELVKNLFEVTEHRGRLYRSRITSEVIAAPLPKDEKLAGLVGSRLTALLAFEEGACHEWHCRFCSMSLRRPSRSGEATAFMSIALAGRGTWRGNIPRGLRAV